MLAWLYVAAIAVLIGATLNAEIDRLWPSADTARARALGKAPAGQEPGATAATAVPAPDEDAGDAGDADGAGTNGKNCNE